MPVAPGRDGRPSAQVTDVCAKRVAAVAAVGDDPPGYAGQPFEQRHRVLQFMRLPGRQDKRDGPADGVADHAKSGSEAD